MNRIYLQIVLILASACIVFGFNFQTGGELVHVSPNEVIEGESLPLEAIYTGDIEDIASAKILYRLAGQVGYLEEFMRVEEMKLKGEIPGETVGAPAIEYVIVVNLNDGGLMAFPDTEDPLTNPVRLAVSEPSGELAEVDGELETAQLVILTPDKGDVIPFGEPILVAVSLFNLENVDINSVKIYLDNIDVTAYSLVTTDLVTYKPDVLSAGKHTIYIEVANIYGVRLAATSWNFIIQSQAQQLFDVRFNGSLNLSHRADVINLVSATVDSVVGGDTVSVNQYSAQTNDVSRLDFTTNADFDWAKVKLYANLTSKEDSTLQPQNRYGVSVRSSWVRYTYGDATPMVNRLALWGKRVRGHSLDLRFRWVNLQLVSGQTKRSITGNARYDSAAVEWQRSGYSFERGLWAIRPSIGGGKNFQLGVFYVHSRDSVNSVREQPQWWTGEDYTATLVGPNETTLLPWGQDQLIHEGDTSDVLYALRGSAPEDNVVMGSDIMFAFDDRRLVLRGNMAFSLYNRNILDGPLSRAMLDTFALLSDTTLDGAIGTGTFGELDADGNPVGIPFSDFDAIFDKPILKNWLDENGQFDPAGSISDFFILNENMSLPVDLAALEAGKYLSAISSLALNFSARMNYFNNFIAVDYHHVGPGYRAFGNPVLRTDRSGWSGWKVTDKMRLLNNMIYLNLGWESYATNTASLDPISDPRTEQRSVTGGFTFNPGRGLPVVTTNMKYYTRDNNVDTLSFNATLDSILNDPRELNNTLTSTVNLTYIVPLGGIENTINLNIMSSNKEDAAPAQVDGAVVDRGGSLRSSSLYGLNLRTEFAFPLITNIMIRSNRNAQFVEGHSQFSSNQFMTVGASAGYRLLNDALTMRTGIRSITFTKESMDGSDLLSTEQNQFNWDFNLQYKFPNLTIADYTVKTRLTAGTELRTYSGDYYDYTDRLLTVKLDTVF